VGRLAFSKWRPCLPAFAASTSFQKPFPRKLLSRLSTDHTTEVAKRPRSYTSAHLTALERFQEARTLYERYRQRAEQECDTVVRECETARLKIEKLLGRQLIALNLLDVGPGPFLAYSNYFAVDNDVTAIDSDAVPVGLSPLPYLQMLWYNGAWRTAKTVGRKILGIDRTQRKELRKRMGTRKPHRVHVLQGDICNSGIAGGSFDVVYCRSVMQHIIEPERALTEMARLLRPGGVLYVSLHLYTSHNGARPFAPGNANHAEDLFWAHLRPNVEGAEGSTAVLNRLRLSEWKSLFTRICPGHSLEIIESSDPRAKTLAEKLVASGELPGYTSQELVAHELVLTWRKAA